MVPLNYNITLACTRNIANDLKIANKRGVTHVLLVSVHSVRRTMKASEQNSCHSSLIGNFYHSKCGNCDITIARYCIVVD